MDEGEQTPAERVASETSARQPWGAPGKPEPLFNIPWTIAALCLGLLGLYAVQSWVGTDWLNDRFAVSRIALEQGRYDTLLFSMFLHASWMHVITNTVAALAFGPPTARLMGSGPRGALVFFLFYLVLGVIADLGFVATDSSPLGSVGASGAIAGLLGATVRLVEGRGRIGPLFGRTVIVFTLVWGVVNFVVGEFRLNPGAIGVPVAWQAHLFGYLAGLLLVGVFARLAGRDGTAFTH